MKKNLNNVYDKINYEEYTLKEIASFFELYHNYTIIIETDKFTLKTKITKNALPHILGLHHIYFGKKDSKDYRRKRGFEKLINGNIKTRELKEGIKNAPKSKLGWKMIQRRIEFLPMFLNTIQRRTRLKVISNDNLARNSLIEGDYALFKTSFEKW